MRDHLNLKVKHRHFRPFAPVILEENKEYFNQIFLFMLLVAKSKPSKYFRNYVIKLLEFKLQIKIKI